MDGWNRIQDVGHDDGVLRHEVAVMHVVCVEVLAAFANPG